MPTWHPIPGRWLGGAFLALLLVGAAPLARAEILWLDPDSRVAHRTEEGYDILGGAVKRDDTASDTLYFKLRVEPLSDVGTEEYFAALQLFEGDEYRLAIGNAPEAWAFSAFYTSETGGDNRLPGEFNLNSARREAQGLGQFKPYEIVRSGVARTFVLQVRFIPGGDDLVTVWLDPEIERGATADGQPAGLTTKFKANCSFDQIRLRHGGGGNGWIFSDMAISTSFGDFVIERFWQTWWFNLLAGLFLLSGVVATVRLVERRKFQHRLRFAEQERALERERTRIAQDLHDDLGSSLTRISLVSGLLRADKEHPEQIEAHAVKLSQAASQTVRALEEIVWALRPGSDTLQSLVEYIAHFARELFEGDTARCRLDLPADLPAVALPPELRHNLFLVVKEALTNALKHSGARQVLVTAQVDAGRLAITVADDGRGFTVPANGQGTARNGLGNMQRRAEAMRGEVRVTSAPGDTRVTVSVPLPPQPAGDDA